jgi:hypothetical protein
MVCRAFSIVPLRIVDALQSSKRIKIVQSDASLETRGWQLFRNRSDKAWGMTDCVSMALMADLEIETAFTSDHHFEQAGFNILLK